jgi:radical SAM superfamily enzyme YgiQ (UPF0313 family)
MPPAKMLKLYPTFEKRDDVYYATYTRGDKFSRVGLEKLLPNLQIDPKYLGFNIGIEFPSDSILKYMDKGLSVSDHLDFIKLCCENEIRLHFNFILGWKNTTIKEVKDVEFFLNKLSSISKPNTITANIYPLTIVEGRKMFSDYTRDELDPFATDYDAFLAMPKLSEEQLEFNNEIKKMYYEYPFLKLHDHSKESWAKNSYGSK